MHIFQDEKGKKNHNLNFKNNQLLPGYDEDPTCLIILSFYMWEIKWKCYLKLVLFF